MSTIRMTPELIATIETGTVVRVVEGGAPAGAVVRSVRVEDGGYEGYPATIVVEVDDGINGDRRIVFERVDRPEPPFTATDVAILQAVRDATLWNAEDTANPAKAAKMREVAEKVGDIADRIARALGAAPEGTE